MSQSKRKVTFWARIGPGGLDVRCHLETDYLSLRFSDRSARRDEVRRIDARSRPELGQGEFAGSSHSVFYRKQI